MVFDWNIALGIVAPIVTVIGLVVANLQTKKQLFAEVEKINKQFSSEKLEDIPQRLLAFQSSLSSQIKNGAAPPTVLREYKDIMFKIVSYGSEDACKIANEYLINMSKSLKDQNGTKSMIYTALMCAQIKHDLTGNWTKPSVWLSVYITDLEDPDVKLKVLGLSAEVVGQLGLSKSLL